MRILYADQELSGTWSSPDAGAEGSGWRAAAGHYGRQWRRLGGALPFFALSSFMVPLQAAFGWPRGDTGLAATILAGGVFLTAAMTLAGLCDRFGAQSAWRCWSIVALRARIWQLIARGRTRTYGWFYSGSSRCLPWWEAATTSIAYSRMIAAVWFRASPRGLALGIMASGGGITALLLPVLLNRVIEDHGWRDGVAGMRRQSRFCLCRCLLALGADRTPAHAGAPATGAAGLTMSQAAWHKIVLAAGCRDRPIYQRGKRAGRASEADAAGFGRFVPSGRGPESPAF